jgi:hypothetical protein
MAIPTTKTALLTAIETDFNALMRDLSMVPPDLATLVELDGHAAGTMISVADLVAYLIGWNTLVLKWHDRDRAGLSVDFPATGFGWNELGRLAQRFYADQTGLSFPDRLDRLTAAEARIVALVNGLDQAALYGAPWYKTHTLGRMIQLNTASPYRNARGRLRRWMAGRGLPTSPRRGPAAAAAPRAEQEVRVSPSGPPARHDRCR